MMMEKQSYIIWMYIDGETISIIEWSDLISESLPNERLEIKFKIVDENVRILKITPYGKKYEDLCEAIL